MDESTEGQAIPEGGGEVRDLHIGVRLGHLLTPFLQAPQTRPARHPNC